MTIVRKWSGDGLTAGSATTASVGTGDNAFTSVAAGVNIEAAGDRSPRLVWPSTSNTLQCWWTGIGNLTDLAYRRYWTVTGDPTASFYLGTLADSSGTVVFQVIVTATGNGTGKLRIRTTDNIDSTTISYTSGVTYRVEIVRSGSTATAYWYQGDQDTPLITCTRTVPTTAVDRLSLGQVAAVNVPGLTADDVALSDQPHLIGPVSVAPPVDPGEGTGDQSQYLAIIGDSLTYQNGNGEANLEALLEDNGWYIPNISFYACSGKGINYRDSNNRLTTEDIAAARTELGHEPYMWVISLGTNGASGYTTTDINTIVTKINEVGSPGRILWIGCGDRDTTAKYQTFNAMAAPVINATTNGEFLDYQVFASSIDPSNFNTSDGLHMPPQGYALRNAYVAEHIGEPPNDDPTGPQWYRYNGTSWVLQTVTVKQ